MIDISRRSILSYYIRDSRVDYSKLREDETIRSLIHTIENSDLSGMSHDEEFAFWLNAYNFITLKSVLQRLDKNPNWRGNLGIWSKIKFFVLEKHTVARNRISLYNLENKILRKKFNDPRIHFAINCASVSCPALPGKLFVAEDLEQYLEELTVQFVNSDNVQKRGSKLYVSEIFKMYKNDFQPSILEFIRNYSKEDLSDVEEVKYLTYDWSINCT